MDKDIVRLQALAGKGVKGESRSFKLAAVIGSLLVFLVSFYLLKISRDVSYLVAWLYGLYVMLAYNLVCIARLIKKN